MGGPPIHERPVRDPRRWVLPLRILAALEVLAGVVTVLTAPASSRVLVCVAFVGAGVLSFLIAHRIAGFGRHPLSKEQLRTRFVGGVVAGLALATIINFGPHVVQVVVEGAVAGVLFAIAQAAHRVSADT
jgi:hypothetical protein